MKTIVLSAICCLGIASAQDAQKINEAAVRKAAFAYAKEQVKALEGEDDNWDLNFEARISNTIKQPEGGYLFRFFIDLDGDGQQELFLSCTYKSQKVFDCWVYALDATGNYALAGKDFIIDDSFSWSTEPGKRELQIVFEPLGKETDTGLHRYVINPGAKLDKQPLLVWEEEEFTQQFGEDMDKFKQTYHIGEKVTFAAEKITLADFLRDANAKWRPYDTTFSPRRQHNCDVEAVKRSADFTFIKALEILGLEVPQYLRKQAAEAETAKPAPAPSAP